MKRAQHILFQPVPEALTELLSNLLVQIHNGVETPLGLHDMRVMDVQNAINDWVDQETKRIEAENEAAYIAEFDERWGAGTYHSLPASARADLTSHQIREFMKGAQL